MAANFPGEWEIRINYNVDLSSLTMFHQQRFSFDATSIGAIGGAFTDWFPILRSGTDATDLQVLANNYAAMLQDYYAASAFFSNIELWRYAALSFDATWYSDHSLALTGTGATPNVENSQQIISYRTDAGGIFKATWMQGPVERGSIDLLPLADINLDTMADHILGTGNWFKGRDGGYPISFLALWPGESEALFKKRHR